MNTRIRRTVVAGLLLCCSAMVVSCTRVDFGSHRLTQGPAPRFSHILVLTAMSNVRLNKRLQAEMSDALTGAGVNCVGPYQLSRRSFGIVWTEHDSLTLPRDIDALLLVLPADTSSGIMSMPYGRVRKFLDEVQSTGMDGLSLPTMAQVSTGSASWANRWGAADTMAPGRLPDAFELVLYKMGTTGPVWWGTATVNWKSRSDPGAEFRELAIRTVAALKRYRLVYALRR